MQFKMASESLFQDLANALLIKIAAAYIVPIKVLMSLDVWGV
jgi:hypothetical protein